MSNTFAKSWDGWLGIVAATRQQVTTAVGGHPDPALQLGLCGLAIASTAIFLEGYTSLHMETHVTGAVRKVFQGLSVPERCR